MEQALVKPLAWCSAMYSTACYKPCHWHEFCCRSSCALEKQGSTLKYTPTTKCTPVIVVRGLQHSSLLINSTWMSKISGKYSMQFSCGLAQRQVKVATSCKQVTSEQSQRKLWRLLLSQQQREADLCLLNFGSDRPPLDMVLNVKSCWPLNTLVPSAGKIAGESVNFGRLSLPLLS